MYIVWWRGWGIIVVGIAFVALALAVTTAYQFKVYAQLFTLLGGYLVVAGFATRYLGKRMNANAERTLVDPATGAEVVVRDHHSLFSVRVERWGPIMVVVAVFLLVTEFL
jgi:hypothetical protein